MPSPRPADIESLKNGIENIEIADELDYSEYKNKFTQLNTQYSQSVKKYENELKVFLSLILF